MCKSFFRLTWKYRLETLSTWKQNYQLGKITITLETSQVTWKHMDHYGEANGDVIKSKVMFPS